MSRRVLLRAVLLLVVVLAGALVLPDVRWWLYGHLRGEAMYRGKPTTYSAGRLKAEPCEVRQYADPLARAGIAVRVVSRPALAPPGALHRLLGLSPSPSDEVLFEGG